MKKCECCLEGASRLRNILSVGCMQKDTIPTMYVLTTSLEEEKTITSSMCLLFSPLIFSSLSPCMLALSTSFLELEICMHVIYEHAD